MTEYVAYYLWVYLSNIGKDRGAIENWLLAEKIVSGDRPYWLFSDPAFLPFTTNP